MRLLPVFRWQRNYVPFLVKIRIYLCPSLRFVFKAKNSVSSGKHNDRLSVRIQSIVEEVVPMRWAPKMEVISSIVLDITLFPFEHLSTVIFLLSPLSLTVFDLKGLVGFWFRIKRTVSQSLTYFVPFFQEWESRRCKIAIAETFPDVLNGKRTGMHHIVSIETIITQLIYHNFIRRKIVAEIHLTTNLVNCDE